MILDETIQILKTRYLQSLEDLIIKEVRIGLYMSAVKLSDNSVGLSSTAKPVNSEIHCKKEERDYGDFTPNRITGRKVIDLLESEKKGPLIDTIKIAVLNAISSEIINNSGHNILRNTDPVDLINPSDYKTITLVGAFQSYIQKLSLADNQLFVLEFNEQALEKDEKKILHSRCRIYKNITTLRSGDHHRAHSCKPYT